ncbi:transglutaminaseTgpA domain-containing protein [Parvibium lacunae]|nr:DUF3488 and transglutaminase-like domain-containing protein [Parvibium lacunae]
MAKEATARSAWQNWQLTWALRPHREQLQFLLLLISGMIVLPHLPYLPWWISLGFGALLGLRLWQLLTRRASFGPWARSLMVLLASAGIWLTYRTLIGQEAGTAYLLLLLALKLQEQHTRFGRGKRPTDSLRDLYLTLFLGLFLLLAGFFNSQSLLLALYLLLCIVVILIILIYAHQLPASAEISTTVSASTGLSDVARRALVLCLQAIPLMIVLFFLFPRSGGPLWGIPRDQASAKTGMSASMRPGDINQLIQNPSIALRAEFVDGSVAIQAQRAQLYWRGPVLDNFDGRSWRSTESLAATTRELPDIRLPANATRSVSYRVTLEPQGYQWLFLLDWPDRFPRVERQVGQLGFSPSGVSRFQLQARGGQPLPQVGLERLRYEASSNLSAQLNDQPDTTWRERWLQLPPGFNPRTLELAQTWKLQALRQRGGDAPGAEESQAIDSLHHTLIQQALRYLREQGFVYSLSPPLLGQHSVDEFLFQTRSGFCEHYSSAFVVLMRALDIPARVVTGYQGGEPNEVDDTWVVRQSDAHAWTEVWLPLSGWTRVDPTAMVAPERLNIGASAQQRQQQAGWRHWPGLSWVEDSVRAARLRWEALNHRWNQWVLQYNREQQQSLLQRLGLAQQDWRRLSAYVLVALAGGMGILASWILLPWRQWWQRGAHVIYFYWVVFILRQPSLIPPERWLARLYLRFEQRCLHLLLAQSGLPVWAYSLRRGQRQHYQRQGHEGWATWGQRVLIPLPGPTRDAAQAILAQLLALRYRPLGRQAESTAATTQALLELETCIHRLSLSLPHAKV